MTISNKGGINEDKQERTGDWLDKEDGARARPEGSRVRGTLRGTGA